MTPNNLRSVVAQIARGGRSVVSSRNLSSSANQEFKGAGDVLAKFFLPRVFGLALGYGIGYFLCEDQLSELDAKVNATLAQYGRRL